MENNEFFTPEEHKQLIQLYKRLLLLSKDTLQKDDCRKLKNHLIKAMSEGTIPRNVFQMNPIIKDMQTAVIVAEEIGMRRASILGIMLHESVKYNLCSLESVKEEYGEDVAGIIRGLVKINELYSKSPIIESENFRNLLLSFAEDMRVILIIIADRVNLMRQIKDSPNEEMYMSVKSITSFLMQALSYSSEKKKREAVLEKTKAATAMYGQLVKEEEGHLSRLQETKAELQKRHEAAAKALMEKDKDGIMEGKVKLEKEKNSITEAGTAVRALSNEISRQKTEQEALENIRKQYLDAGARLLKKKELAEKAEKEFADARELYEKMKESADDWARIARSRLRVGDICPVCGQKVMSVMSDAEFDTLLKPVSDRYSGAENRFREAVRGLDEAKVMLKTLEDRLSEASRRASEAVKIMEEYRKSAGEKCAVLELDPGQEGILEHLVGMWRDCERREKETEALLKDISVLEEQDRQTVRQISELDTEIRAASENLEKQKSVKN